MTIKSSKDIEMMAEGGKKLAFIKKELKKGIKSGVSAGEIENLAEKLIRKSGGKASFKMVSGYRWATCVNVNEGIVHGIPHKKTIFKKGDIVSVDVGLFYKGFHTDTSFSVAIDASNKTKNFLQVGESTLEKAIKRAVVGNRIFDISEAMETHLEKAGFSPIRALVGHGIGKSLHEDPQIPCFTKGSRKASPEILEGAVLAIEVMYTDGSPEIRIEEDGWTISTQDGKIASLFEETVAVTAGGPFVLT